MDLAELVKQAERQAMAIQEDAKLPYVQRTISEVLEDTQELHARVTQDGVGVAEAHKLMSAHNIDLSHLTQKFESLTLNTTFEPVEVGPIDTDVRGYLDNERENIILSLINETNTNVFESVEKRKWQGVYEEWGEEKERLLNAFDKEEQEEEFPDEQHQQVATELNQEPDPKSHLHRIELLYAEDISSYNQRTIQGEPRSSLVTTFKTLAQSFEDADVLEMWCVLEYMVDVGPLSGDEDPIEMRQTSPEFVEQACKYLESRYKTYMSTIIDRNLALAKRSLKPNVCSFIISFVRVRFQTPMSLLGLDDVMDGLPLWPLVYYSLRCGDSATAIQFLNQAGCGIELATIMQQNGNADGEEQNCKLRVELKLEYSNKKRMVTDIYKKAVYNVVLACDPSESHAEVASTIDDFLWLKLSMLRNEDMEQLTYGDLQSLILEKYGESYFNACERAPLYFQVLALTGQFESAIEFLGRSQANRPHAVHMAIALNELSMLGATESVEKPLLYAEPDDPPPMHRLNLARLIIMYAKAFEQTDTARALQYYYFLRNFKDSDGRNLFLACVCALLMDNYDEPMMQLVFGMPEGPESWCYSGGILAQLAYDHYTLGGMVGDEFAQRSDFEPAIKLYYVGGQMDKALKVVCSLLTQLVPRPPQEGSMRSRLGYVTQKMNAALAESTAPMEGQTVVKYKMLSQLMLFFDYYHTGELRMAGEILAKHKLMPSRTDEVNDCLSRLKSVGSELFKLLPDVLLAAMDIVYQEYGCVKKSNGNKSHLRLLRERASAYINMATVVPFRMPPDINKRLVLMEILMI